MENFVGKQIRSLRLSLGETMEEFGTRFNTSKGTINNWEKGRNLPNKESLLKIAILLDTTVEDLLHSRFGKVEFEKRMRNRDTELRVFIFEELVIFLNELKYSEFNYVIRESEKINKIVSLIIKSETDDKEEKLKEFVNDLVDNLMSKTYILYWDFVYELCFSEDDIKKEVYVSGMLFNFLMEYLQTDERYTLPLILFRLEETKKDIESLTVNISNDSKQPINKVDLLKRIDDLIAFVSNINK